MACLIYNVIHLSVDYGQRRSQLDPLAVDVIRLVCRAGKGENLKKKKIVEAVALEKKIGSDRLDTYRRLDL